MKPEIVRMAEELQKLKDTLADRDAEIDKLKQRLTASESSGCMTCDDKYYNVGTFYRND